MRVREELLKMPRGGTAVFSVSARRPRRARVETLRGARAQIMLLD